MPNFTHYQSQFLAHWITLEGVSEDAFAKSLSTARVEMNPHQVDAALFALQPPIPGGAILAAYASGVGRRPSAFFRPVSAVTLRTSRE